MLPGPLPVSDKGHLVLGPEYGAIADLPAVAATGAGLPDLVTFPASPPEDRKAPCGHSQRPEFCGMATLARGLLGPG